jgi:hypothetical protein
MEIRNEFADKIDEMGDESMGPMYGIFNCYQLLRCPVCNKTTIRSYGWNEIMDGEEVELDYEYLYPNRKQIPVGLPAVIEKAYREADVLKLINVNAYVGQLRRLLELVCNDRQAPKGKLTNRLKELGKRDEIPSKLVKVATGLKDFGDMGAHAVIALSEEEVPIISSLCDAILEYVYSAPYLADLAESKLKELRAKERMKKLHNGNGTL